MPGRTVVAGAIMNVVDAGERQQALEVNRSFCVTAPAGSGKTELLIQRYLALLVRVDRPEQVLAITFTRKAAAEMRERVLQALNEALQNRPCEGSHQQVTRDLALAALAMSTQKQWHLTRDISRLNIKTIDSFCSGLTRQMPILSTFGGQAKAIDDATELYREAVLDLFSMLQSGGKPMEDLGQLLLHFDNNWERLSDLLITMLGKRDQWYESLGEGSSAQDSEDRLHLIVTRVINETLTDLHQSLSPWQEEILDLLCYANHHLELECPDEFPAPEADKIHFWRDIRRLLLTQQGSFRKSVTVRDGFPAGKGEPTDRKDHLKDLIARMRDLPELETQLQAVSGLPDMSDNSESWQLVVHLSHVLPLLAACLLLVFERRSLVDHTQVALSALDALGDDDNPTELALRLDYSIEHILVDEFQDTAINQYRLLERLTRGWAEHNAINPERVRTLFIVGDGMQSIYRFRDANVGLFLKAREVGFNGVVPQLLVLQCNFRSQQGVVDWVNETFERAFPAEDDVRRGRVSFSPAVAIKSPEDEPAIDLNGFYGDSAAEQEATWLVEEIARGHRDESIESIAILGRSRGQLAPIMALLRANHIPFAAQDMDKLSGSPAIVDLLSLCRALANPADRVAWFALLRSPCCCLSLADMHALVQASDEPQYMNIAGVLLTQQWPDRVSKAGQQSLERISHWLQWAELKRDRLALRVWIEQLWLKLGGAAALPEQRFLGDAQRFFELLQQAEQEGVGLDIDWLQTRIDKLFAASENAEAKIQIMTLHKSKGLEFDWVIIPALAKGTRSDSRDILLWDEYISPEGERGFLLAADDHSDPKSPSLYNFLKSQRKEKSLLETTRLLYVGATRAVRKLTLTACLNAEDEDASDFKDPPSGSLLACIWTTFKQQMVVHEPVEMLLQDIAPVGVELLQLMNPPAIESPVQDIATEQSNVPERALNIEDRHIGTVIHWALEKLSLEPELPNVIPEPLAAASKLQLMQLGLWGGRLDGALARVKNAVTATLEDEKGRWILSSKHPEAASELPLTYNLNGVPEDLIIDRSFLDTETSTLWVVDYKNSIPVEGQSLEQFLQQETLRYRPKLALYKNSLTAIKKETEPRAVCCALYFTSLALWHPVDLL